MMATRNPTNYLIYLVSLLGLDQDHLNGICGKWAQSMITLHGRKAMHRLLRHICWFHNCRINARNSSWPNDAAALAL